jgi:protein-tyrosine phosphatase
MKYYKDKIINTLYDSLVPEKYAQPHVARLAESIRMDMQITFVCKGNICRSAFAEHHLRKHPDCDEKITICSAGLDTRIGLPADSRAIELAKEFSVDLEDHRTTPLSVSHLEESDLLFVMEPSQLHYLCWKHPQFRKKIFLFSILVMTPSASWVIKDPYGKDDTLFRETFHNICKGNEKLLAMISANS